MTLTRETSKIKINSTNLNNVRERSDVFSSFNFLDLQNKSMNRFLFDRDLRHDRVKANNVKSTVTPHTCHSQFLWSILEKFHTFLSCVFITNINIALSFE